MRITLSSMLVWGVMVWPVMAAVRATAAPLSVEVTQGDGTVTAGLLDRIDAAGVHLVGVGGGTDGSLSLPSDRVRSVQRTGGPATAADGRPRLVLTLVDGSTLTGEDFAWDGQQPAVLIRPEGRIELPVGRVRSLAWLPDGAAVDAVAPWQGAMPEGTEKDLVVVGTADNHEFVECAITAVSADTVTVQLEDETIPVKRSKVIGLQWLRGEPAAAATAAGRAVVAVSGGGVRAGRVEWSADGLVLDADLRLPATMLIGIDYAAARIVPLASITAEKVDVDPWFGGLVRTGGRTDAMVSFFAPRTIGTRARDATAAPMAAEGTRGDGGAAAAAIVMRPRTVSVWRLPPDSRRFHAVVEAVAGPQAADATVVAVAVDDRELFRRQIGGGATAGGDDRQPVRERPGEGVPIDVDLTSGRRLTVTVDFGPGGGIGGAVRFDSPVIER